MTAPTKTAALAALLLATVALGCGEPRVRSTVGHYIEPTGKVGQTARVVFVPLFNRSGYPDVERGMTRALLTAIQQKHLFHVELPPRTEEAVPYAEYDGERFTLRDLASMRRELKCDAVLVGVVNQFQPYPHMQTGLYLRLIDLRDGSLLWAVDHVWDTTEQQTQDVLEYYYAKYIGLEDNPLKWRVATVSPRAFQRFVAWEVVQTLPRPGEAPGGMRVSR